MLETSARLLRLLSLLQTRPDWSAAELAERLGVSARTIRRDVERLRDLGYPVHAARGVAGYRLGAGTALPPLLLDDEEAVAVAVGLRTAAGASVTGIQETSIRALAKLEQVLPSRLRHRVQALQAATVEVPAPGRPTVDAAVLTALAAACRDHQRLRFDYRDHDGSASVRSVEPHRLVHDRGRWYLVAWDSDRADWRTFRADRITSPQITGPRFTPRDPPGGDPAAYVSQSVSTTPYRYQARIRLHVPASAIAERLPPTVGHLQADGEHACILHTGAESPDVLAIYVAILGAEFEILDPPELAEHVLALASRLTRAARR